MGSQFIDGMLSSDDISLEQVISLHFAQNCYPPIPQIMVPVALEAIENAVCGEDNAIKLPEGVSFRGSDCVSTADAIDGLFISRFVEDIYEEYNEGECEE